MRAEIETDMRGNPDGSLSSPGASRAAALFPVYRWDLFRRILLAPIRWGRDKVMAGGTPANPATLVSAS
jgi:hypothetical protein